MGCTNWGVALVCHRQPVCSWNLGGAHSWHLLASIGQSCTFTHILARWILFLSKTLASVTWTKHLQGCGLGVFPYQETQTSYNQPNKRGLEWEKDFATCKLESKVCCERVLKFLSEESLTRYLALYFLHNTHYWASLFLHVSTKMQFLVRMSLMLDILGHDLQAWWVAIPLVSFVESLDWLKQQ